MAKFFIAALLCVVACAQLSCAASIAEAIDIDLRENLNGYNKILPGVDAAYKADLEKLITQTEAALKETDPKEKNKILDALHGAFPEEFNQYLSKKLQELHIDAEIQRSLAFYNALLAKAEAGEWKQDIEQAIANLNSITSEVDAAKKVELYTQFSKQLNTDFRDFLKKQTLPQIEKSLSGTIQFFDDLLAAADAPYKNEITALKTQAEAGLAATTLEEKQKIYYEVTNPADKELFNYLKEKYIEKH